MYRVIPPEPHPAQPELQAEESEGPSSQGESDGHISAPEAANQQDLEQYESFISRIKMECTEEEEEFVKNIANLSMNMTLSNPFDNP